MNNKKISVRYYLNTKLKPNVEKTENGDKITYPIYIQIIYDKRTSRFAAKSVDRLIYTDELEIEKLNNGLKGNFFHKDASVFKKDVLENIIRFEIERNIQFTLVGISRKIYSYLSVSTEDVNSFVQVEFEDFLKDYVTYNQYMFIEKNGRDVHYIYNYVCGLDRNFRKHFSERINLILTAYWLVEILMPKTGYYEWIIENEKLNFIERLNDFDMSQINKMNIPTDLELLILDFSYIKENKEKYIAILDTGTNDTFGG